MKPHLSTHLKFEVYKMSRKRCHLPFLYFILLRIAKEGRRRMLSGHRVQTCLQYFLNYFEWRASIFDIIYK